MKTNHLTDKPAAVEAAPIIVLKFGSSILRTAADLPRAAHEVYRHVRAGHRVVAVVSAFEGRTDALLRSARLARDGDAARADDERAAEATALLAATGEAESAALFGLALDRAGLVADVLTQHAATLRTRGTILDSSLVGIAAESLHARLQTAHVLVVPGFVGLDERGRTCLLGRGGSDLSALFIAKSLNADRCRLVKDVPGLFEHDPAKAGPPPARFARITFDDALKLDGGIVQHKAIRYARENDLRFEVGSLLDETHTLVGAERTEVVAPTAGKPRRTRVALLGAGVVGFGVYSHLTSLKDDFEVVAVLCRDHDKAAARGVPRRLLRSTWQDALATQSDLVIECLGGTEPARDAIESALRSGRHVVTANKAVAALHGEAFTAIADEAGVLYRQSACVGGAAPVLETCARIAERAEITRVEGVLNATANFILNATGAGDSFEDAVRKAREAGLAEADASRDLNGLDAADKLILIARAAWGVRLTHDRITRDTLDEASVSAACAVLRGGQNLRVIGKLERDGAGVRASVRLSAVDAGHPLADLPGARVGTLISATERSRIVIASGAGRWPTAESVLADALDCRGRPQVAEARTPRTAISVARGIEPPKSAARVSAGIGVSGAS